MRKTYCRHNKYTWHLWTSPQLYDGPSQYTDLPERQLGRNHIVNIYAILTDLNGCTTDQARIETCRDANWKETQCRSQRLYDRPFPYKKSPSEIREEIIGIGYIKENRSKMKGIYTTHMSLHGCTTDQVQTNLPARQPRDQYIAWSHVSSIKIPYKHTRMKLHAMLMRVVVHI